MQHLQNWESELLHISQMWASEQNTDRPLFTKLKLGFHLGNNLNLIQGIPPLACEYIYRVFPGKNTHLLNLVFNQKTTTKQKVIMYHQSCILVPIPLSHRWLRQRCLRWESQVDLLCPILSWHRTQDAGWDQLPHRNIVKHSKLIGTVAWRKQIIDASK